MGLIKTLINSFSFELGLIVGAKQAFLSLMPPNDFHAYSFDNSVQFVRSDMSETFVYEWTFLMKRHLYPVIIVYDIPHTF